VKGKILLFSSVVLLMLFVVAPVMACTSYPASALTTGFAPPSPTPGETFTTPSGLVITVGATVNVFAILTINGLLYYIYSVNTYYSINNPKAGSGYAYYDAVWYIESSSTGTAHTTDGFSGFVSWLSTGSTEYVRSVLQGFGSFRGQTLSLSYTGPPGLGEYYWTGNDLIH